jgi:hypothetical protein
VSHLGFIPIPYRDELLYSVIARLQTLALYSPGKLNMDLFGNRSIHCSIDLPSHMSIFYNSVKDIFPYSEDEIIDKLTLWPFYSRFVRESKRDTILQMLKGCNGSGIHNRVGINPSPMVKARRLKYCPECLAEDKQSHNDLFWHRAHQIPDLPLCPIHFCDLLNYVYTPDELGRLHYIDANILINKEHKAIVNNDPRLREITEIFSSMLTETPFFSIDQPAYCERVLQNYLKNKSIDANRLLNDFGNFYSESLLKQLLPNLGYSWLILILKRPLHFFHPLRHVLLYNFSLNLKEQIRLSEDGFGRGPWKCINKAADHYGQLVIKVHSTHRDSKSGRTIGLFKCSCGMVYSKSNKKKDDRTVEFIRILDWGIIWKNKLRSQLAQKNSYRQIARQLGTDASTVSKHADLLKHPPVLLKLPKRFKEKRKAWIKLLHRYEYDKIQNAKKKNNSLYSWLYRNDHVWLLATNKVNSLKKGSPQLRLNWRELDIKIYNLIDQTIKELKERKYKGRITRSLISNIIKSQHYLIGKNSSKLPRSKALLDTQVETDDQFAIRRIDNAFSSFKTFTLPAWKVMRRAGISKKSLTPAVENFLHLKLKNG